jgi:hypothetical protein
MSGENVKTKFDLLALAIAATLSLSVASCQKAANANTASNQAGNAVAVNASPAANTAAPVAADTSTNSIATPTDAYKAAYAARKNKDVPALKKLMSKDIIEFFTELGGMGDKKQTLDELLFELCEKPQAPTAEARNEKIDGDTATIEYLDEKGGWSTMDFIKEDGGWKLTIPKFDKSDLEIGDPGKNDPKKGK